MIASLGLIVPVFRGCEETVLRSSKKVRQQYIPKLSLLGDNLGVINYRAFSFKVT